MIPAILHTLAFLICLCVQTMGSPFASAWLFFHIAACIALVYNQKYELEHSWVWYLSLAWLITLGLSAFFFASVPGAASIMFILAAMPSLALCLRSEHIKPYAWCFGSIIVLYAAGLVVQQYFNMSYTMYSTEDRRAWPLLDPNNGACLINIALIPCVYMTFFRDLRWIFVVAVLAAGIYCTGSITGIFGAMVATGIISSIRFGWRFMIFSTIMSAINLAAVFVYRPEWVDLAELKLSTRFPIWESSWSLLSLRPLGGLGLGTFGSYYQQIRTETLTGGWFAHNDALQFAVEMGIPAALVFIALCLSIFITTRRENLVSGVTFLAVFLGAMVEFQFYVPAISLPMGLVLAYHIIHSRKHCALR